MPFYLEIMKDPFSRVDTYVYGKVVNGYHTFDPFHSSCRPVSSCCNSTKNPEWSRECHRRTSETDLVPIPMRRRGSPQWSLGSVRGIPCCAKYRADGANRRRGYHIPWSDPDL